MTLTRRLLAALATAVAIGGSLLAVAAPAQAAEAHWGLHNYNQAGGVEYSFGWGNTATCTPITGDWDGNGTSTPGSVCARTDGAWQWALHNYNAGGGVEYNFAWGSTNCLPLVGDWDANGTETPGTVCANGAEWAWGLHNYNQAGGVEYSFGWGGTAGCWPITGDWNGDRRSTPGLVCPDGNAWRWVQHDYNAGGGVERQFSWGGTSEGCTPMFGDWDGNRSVTPGLICREGNVFRWVMHNYNAAGGVEANFTWGSTAQRPVTGDWDGNGTTTVGTTTLGIGSTPAPSGYSLPVPKNSAPRIEFAERHHDYPAVDISVPTGTAAYAAMQGTVSYHTNDTCGLGMYLTVNGGTFLYCHLSSRLVASGSGVSAGQLIGRTGATGNASGPHLHFQVTVNGTKRCPQPWLLAIYDGQPPPPLGGLPTTGCIS